MQSTIKGLIILNMLRFLIILFFIPSIALASEEASSELMVKAIAYSAVADANNAYCEKESSLADSFISKFIETKKITAQKAEQFRDLKNLQYKKRLEKLQVDAKPCEDLEFMVVRLDTMRKLKNISYRLNGVAEEDIPPDNLPDFEHLLPPKTQDL